MVKQQLRRGSDVASQKGGWRKSAPGRRKQQALRPRQQQVWHVHGTRACGAARRESTEGNRTERPGPDDAGASGDHKYFTQRDGKTTGHRKRTDGIWLPCWTSALITLLKIWPQSIQGGYGNHPGRRSGGLCQRESGGDTENWSESRQISKVTLVRSVVVLDASERRFNDGCTVCSLFYHRSHSKYTAENF